MDIFTILFNFSITVIAICLAVFFVMLGAYLIIYTAIAIKDNYKSIKEPKYISCKDCLCSTCVHVEICPRDKSAIFNEKNKCETCKPNEVFVNKRKGETCKFYGMK